MKICAECGARNGDDETFCRSCQMFLWIPAIDEATAASLPAPLAEPGVAEAPDAAAQADAAGPPADPDLTARALVSSLRLAAEQDRGDLVEQLDEARGRLQRPEVTVAVVGEYKVGKSTLVNALLQTAVCAVDADIVTVVPTLIRYGETARAIAHFETRSEGELDAEIPLESIAGLSSEMGNPANAQRLGSIEVLLPHRLLRSGLRLIDTPGVGGLDSAQGLVTLGVLDGVDGILFVSDAAAELNQPELTFLRSAVARCQRVACVLTKTDLHLHWRQIAELNRAHLADAGVECPILPVSSFLRLRSRRRPELLDESGFRDLVRFLAADVVTPAYSTTATAVAKDVGFAAAQLEQQVEAEQSALREPERAAELVDEMIVARDRAARLASPTATWQQLLGDGTQDLVADVQYDLQERMRLVLKQVEAVIEQTDPKDSWDNIEEWLRRQAVTAAIANYDLLKTRAVALAEHVADSFDLEAGQQLSVDSLRPPADLDVLKLAAADVLKTPGGRLGSMLIATRTAVFVPMALFGIASGLLSAAVMVPISLALGGVIGQKLLRDERKRRLAQRQAQARAASRRFVEEVSFIMNKETQDALRRTQRQLRDDFQRRATASHRSSVDAIEAVNRARSLTDAERTDRASELTVMSRELHLISSSVASATPQHRRLAS